MRSYFPAASLRRNRSRPTTTNREGWIVVNCPVIDLFARVNARRLHYSGYKSTPHYFDVRSGIRAETFCQGPPLAWTVKARPGQTKHRRVVRGLSFHRKPILSRIVVGITSFGSLENIKRKTTIKNEWENCRSYTFLKPFSGSETVFASFGNVRSSHHTMCSTHVNETVGIIPYGNALNSIQTIVEENVYVSYFSSVNSGLERHEWYGSSPSHR